MDTTNAGDESRIDTGADVIGSDGEKLGTVAYVVVHPPEMHVTDIVVSTGALLGRDVVVPMDQVETVEAGKVHLSLDKDGVGRCRDYVELHYDRPPSEWAPPMGYYYPGEMTLWPAGMSYPQPSSVTVNAPSGTVGLHHGMEVESSDGHKVGSIDSVDTDPQTDDLTAIVVKEGFLFSHDVRMPIDCVSQVEEDRVRLNLTADEVKNRFEQNQ